MKKSWIFGTTTKFIILTDKGIQKLLGRPDVELVRADMCGFGTHWKKPTRFLFGGLPPGLHTLPICSNRGLCKFTGKPHLSLDGKYANEGGFRTSWGAADPEGLAEYMATYFA